MVPAAKKKKLGKYVLIPELDFDFTATFQHPSQPPFGFQTLLTKTGDCPAKTLYFSPHTAALFAGRAAAPGPSALGSGWRSGSLAGSSVTPFQAGLHDVSQPLGNGRLCLLSGRCGLSARRGAETTQRGNFCDNKQSSSSPGAASPLSTGSCLGAGINFINLPQNSGQASSTSRNIRVKRGTPSSPQGQPGRLRTSPQPRAAGWAP